MSEKVKDMFIVIGVIASILTIIELTTGCFKNFFNWIMKEIRLFVINRKKRKELSEIIEGLYYYFDFEDKNSFFMVFRETITDQSLEFTLLGKSFKYLRNWFYRSKDLNEIILELIVLVAYWEGMYNELCEKTTKECKDRISDELWKQLKEQYNPIITKLITFVRKRPAFENYKNSFHLLTGKLEKL
ncbi:MAG: hypothetical protein PHE59_05065 [Patescibacteria group bacterium]|nr:hypothetical protein [Patescibacteria group bacterium]